MKNLENKEAEITKDMTEKMFDMAREVTDVTLMTHHYQVPRENESVENSHREFITKYTGPFDYKGYTVSQTRESYNVVLHQKGRRAGIIMAKGLMSEEELKETVDEYIRFKEMVRKDDEV